MATSVASTSPLIPTPQAAGTGATGSTQTRATGTDSPFQTILTATQTQTTATTDAAATGTTDATNIGIAGLETEDTNTDTTTTDTVIDPSLTGLLALATQVLAPPANAAEAQATGQTALTQAAAQATAADTTATRSRADQLRLDRAAAFLPQTTGTAQQTSPLATSRTTAPTQTTNTQTTDQTVPVATAQTTVTAQIATAAVAVPTPATFATRPGGASSIPAQGQILANVGPPVPALPNPSVTAPPAGEPTAVVPATALPAAQIGDRPTMAGERFAADAEAGARLATPGPPTSVVFANTLAQEVSAPTASAVATQPTATAEAAAPVVTFGQPLTNGALTATRPALEIATEVNFGRIVADTTLPPVQPTFRKDESRSADDATTGAAVSVAPQLPTPVPAPQGTTETTALKATPAAQIADTIVTHAHVMERDGRVEFQMRLDPPELGQLQIRLVARGDEIHGHVLVADEAVRGLIESQLPELRQRLEAAGVNVQQFGVSTDPGTGGGRNPYRDAVPQEYFPRVASSTGAPVAPRARIGRPDPGSLDVTV